MGRAEVDQDPARFSLGCGLEDLVGVERRGQYLHYTLNTTVVEDLLRWVIDLKATPEPSPLKSPNHEQ